jgi:hypothetical protein
MNLFPWTTWNAFQDAFLPTAIQAEGLAAVLATGLVMLLLGRAALGPRIAPEIAVIAGWGIVCLVLTLWGVRFTESLRFPAAALVAIAALAAFTERGRLSASDIAAVGRLLVLAIPLLAVLAAGNPSQPDTFTNQLPNAAYLYDYGMFPGADRAPSLSVWPAFPYNLQLAAFLPALLVPEFPPGVLTDVNLLLQLAFALLLARCMRGAQAAGDSIPSWAAIGGALLLTSLLNPGFNPKIQFSGYGDPAIAVALAFAAWQAERTLAALAADRSAIEERLAFALVLLAGAAIKQVSIVLMAAVVAVAFLIGAFDRRIGPGRAFAYLAPAFFPAALLVAVWRFYVATHFAPTDELTLLPVSEWDFANLPAIFENMAVRIWERMPFFIMLYGVCIVAVPLAARRGVTPAIRLFLLTLGVTLLYTGFLVFTYVAHFPGEIGASAHSFFRYNTHLGLLATVALVSFARESWVRRGAPALGPGWRAVGIGGIALATASPLLTAAWIRHDLRQPEPLIWSLAAFSTPFFHDDDHIALLLPGDNGSVAAMLRVAIAITPPRHALADFDDFSRADQGALDEARGRGDRYALITCVPDPLAKSPFGQQLKLTAGTAALLYWNGSVWSQEATHIFPAALPPRRDWTAELSPGPFCQ